LQDKHDLQLTRLALREQAIARHGAFETLVESLVTRYNLPQSPEVVSALLRQTLQAETIFECVVDEHLTAGIDLSLENLVHA
jgi:hypothetical protein